MAIITDLLISASSLNWVGKILEALYNSVGNFGWTVVIFTIVLKVILSPLDIWQRLSSRKQQKKMAALKPKLEKLERQYGKNPDLLKQKQYELQRSEKINVFSSCIPLIVSMVVFFVVFSGFRSLVVYENERNVEILDDAYVGYIVDYNYNLLSEEGKAAVDTNKKANYTWNGIKTACENDGKTFIQYSALKATDEAAFADLNDALLDSYTKNLDRCQWLWVKNVFMSDTGSDVVPTLKAFVSSGVGGVGAKTSDLNTHTSYENLLAPAVKAYNKSGTWDFAKWNGYFVLPLLSLITCFLSTFLMQSATPQSSVGTKEQIAQQQKTMKWMNYFMPVMLAVFAILYSAAFAIYYLMSNVMSTLLTGGFAIYYKYLDKKEKEQPYIITNSTEVKK